MPECLISESLYLAPFMTRFLHNATKKILFSDLLAIIPQHRLCIATKASATASVLEESTQLKMSSDIPNRGSTDDEEWVPVQAGGADDSWVDVDEDVPSDIDRGASDVSKGTISPNQTRIVLQVIKEYYKEESKEAFFWRMANTKK